MDSVIHQNPLESKRKNIYVMNRGEFTVEGQYNRDRGLSNSQYRAQNNDNKTQQHTENLNSKQSAQILILIKTTF
jgi:hypothetical protein